jgi:hypothetical protein
MSFRTAILSLVAGLAAAGLAPDRADAYPMSHETRSRSRAPYGSNMYLSQQAHFARTLTVVEESRPAKGEAAPTGTDYRGYALQTSVGFEHFRFLQTGLFYANSNTNGVGARDRSLGGHEAGVEARVVLTSPVVNVGLGGGAYLAKRDYALGIHRGTLTGTGYKAGIEFSYFASSRVSLVVSGAQQVEKLSDKSSDGLYGRLAAKSLRVGGGLAIWL